MAFTNYIQKITDTGGTTHDLLDSSASHFIRGTQAASTNVWTGPLPDGVSNYYDGLMIDYFLPFAGTSTAATLNLGGKGAKPIYRGNSPTSGTVTTHFPVNSVIHLTYVIQSGINSGNGAWIASAYYDSNSNDTTTGYARFSHGTYTTTTAVGRYVICLSKTPTSVVPVTAVNDSTATTKTLTTDTFNPFEPIYYFTNNGSTTQTAANAALSASYMWTVYSNINLSYSFNTGSTLTTNKDVYIKATPTSGYMATLASTPIVQALPTTDDGFIYIKLGHANSTSNIAMAYEHPVYWYKNGAVRPYGGDAATVSGIPMKLGYTTSGNNRAVQADSNGNLYVTQKDDNSGGTVTKVTAGTGLSIGSTAGGNFTTTGTINHTNSVTAQTTQAVYPIKIDAQGHISAYGSAVTIPTDTNTWRKVQLNGTDKLGTAISTNPLNLKAGTNVSITESSGTFTFSATDTNTTYALSGALSSHKFTSTLTAGGSGSGTSTSDFTLAAGTGITITDDTSARKMTIACSVTNTDTKVTVAALTSGTQYYPILATGTGTATRQIDSTLKGFTYQTVAGTTSTVGNSILQLGNATAAGTANNTRGSLRIYGSGAYYTTLQSDVASTNKTVYLPNRTGTIACLEDIPTIPSAAQIIRW